MRLEWLHIPKHKNLRNFEINFDTESITVLLGRNGSGKSNLIEAIVEIFRELESGRTTTFAYSMKYVCHNRGIEVHADPEKSSRRLSISIDGISIPVSEFLERRDLNLPQYVFGYYSGWSSRLERQFEAPTRNYYNQLLKNADDDMPLRRFFFCRKEYSQLVLLAFFLAGDEASIKLLKDTLNIEAFESTLFVLKKPWWATKGKNFGVDGKEIDSRFWNASGAFLPFLGRLWGKAFAPIRSAESIERDLRRKAEPTERLYLFIKDETQLSALRAPYESPKLLFSNLESLFLCDLIDEVRVNVRKTDGSKVRFAQLSEGEQQLLTVLGLLLFTQGDESLYLLDEPDTHLNPVWTYEFLKHLQDNISADKGQMLVATHNPLMISSLHKNQVRIISKQEESTISAAPEYDPIGIGVEGLLKSELYGLRSTLAPEVLKDLDTQNNLLGLMQRTPEQDDLLAEASARLEQLNISRSHPNPLFDLFAKAIANQSIFTKPVLTKADIESQEVMANEILDKILKGEP